MLKLANFYQLVSTKLFEDLSINKLQTNYSTLSLGTKIIKLSRYPEKGNFNLQAHNAADEYILQQLEIKAQHALIINDNFGALSCACSAEKITFLSDSYIAKQACKHNLAHNHLSPDIQFAGMFDDLKETYDLILLRIPKSLSMLEHQLALLSQIVQPHTKVIAGGMCKEIHNSSLRLFERYLGPSPTSLAKKKARLILPSGQYPQAQAVPKPTSWPLENTDFEICNHASVFAREQLDIGARFFLEHIPQGKYKHIIDLGCGNGVIGLMAAKLNPQATISFVDESEMAVQSAKENLEHNIEQDSNSHQQYHFIQDDCLSSFKNQSCDLILCNPPFHQQNSISDHIAWQMFLDAKKTLQSGGILRIIGNRHLAYQAKLKKIFGNCTQIAANRKFVILESVN